MARKQIAHGRLSFCASGASGSHSTRRSGLSVTNPQLSWHRRAVSVCSIYPGFDAHEAGSDVPSVPFLLSANADPRSLNDPTAAEAHPARSLCARFVPATLSRRRAGTSGTLPRGTPHSTRKAVLLFLWCVRIPQHSTVRSQRHEPTALMAQKGSLHVRHISVCTFCQPGKWVQARKPNRPHRNLGAILMRLITN